MPKPKRHSEKPCRAPQQGEQAPPAPDESKQVEGLRFQSKPGKPGAYGFSLEFPATLTAIVRSEEAGGFSAEVPALPGCFTQAETLDELRDNLREAADGWLKAHYDVVSGDLLHGFVAKPKGRARQ